MTEKERPQKEERKIVEYRIALMYSSNQGHYNCIANDDNDVRRISGYSNFVRWLDQDWQKVVI